MEELELQLDEKLYKQLQDDYFTNFVFDMPCVYEGFTYKVIQDSLVAVSFEDSVIVDGKLTIPFIFDDFSFIDADTHENKLATHKEIVEIDCGRVKTLRKGVFAGCATLETIIGKYVLIVEPMCFKSCVTLRNIDLPSVVSIGEEAFVNCINLLKIDFGTAKIVGTRAFSGCNNLVEADLHGVRFVNNNYGQNNSPEGIFSDCEKLEKVDVSGAFAIGAAMFYGCVNLKELRIPLCRVIYEEGLKLCSSLETIYIDNLLGFKSQSLSGCVSLKNIYYYGDSERWSQVMIEDASELNVLKTANITLNYKDPE